MVSWYLMRRQVVIQSLGMAQALIPSAPFLSDQFYLICVFLGLFSIYHYGL